MAICFQAPSQGECSATAECEADASEIAAVWRAVLGLEGWLSLVFFSFDHNGLDFDSGARE